VSIYLGELIYGTLIIQDYIMSSVGSSIALTESNTSRAVGLMSNTFACKVSNFAHFKREFRRLPTLSKVPLALIRPRPVAILPASD
jgi:hypothetical protein